MVGSGISFEWMVILYKICKEIEHMCANASKHSTEQMKQKLCVQLVKLSSSQCRPKEHFPLKRADYHTGMVPNGYHLIMSMVVILNTNKLLSSSSSSSFSPPSSRMHYLLFVLDNLLSVSHPFAEPA